jgi:hypothetical protein
MIDGGRSINLSAGLARFAEDVRSVYASVNFRSAGRGEPDKRRPVA